MDIKEEFKLQYEKEFTLFSEQKKDKTKIELIFDDIGIPTDNKKLVRNCLICLYSYALYFLISFAMLPLVLIYSASIIEGMFMYILIILSLIIVPFMIKPLSVVMDLFITRNKVLYAIFNEQTVSNELKNIVANSFENDDIIDPMMYNLMNTGSQSGTNGRLKEYVFNPEIEDTKFKDKIKALDGNIKEKIKELRDAQESWEEKQVLDTVYSDNMGEDSIPNNKRKRL